MSTCLTSKELEQYHAGSLDDAALSRVRGHLETCSRCSEHGARVVNRYDDLIDHIRCMGLSAAEIIKQSDRRNAADLVVESSSSAEPDAATLNDLIPGYEVIKPIHHGGQGAVYQAIQRSTKRKVAVKVLLDGLHASDAARKRFEREIELVASLKHANIVSVFDSGMTIDGRQYCVMDYVAGQRLDEYLNTHKPGLPAALKMFAILCETVNHAHQRGVIHRDLKPSNILVDSAGNPKVLDFGLAKQMAGAAEPHVSMTGQILGTLPYMSPEQVRGSVEGVDTRTDVYSLGVLLYEMLTGHYPYPVVGELPDVIKHITETNPERPSKVWDADSGIRFAEDLRGARKTGCPVDDELETIVLKALAKDRDRRYQSALELSRDVGHYLAGEPISAKRDSSWYVLRKTMRRYRGAVVVGVAFVLLLIAWSITLSVFYTQQKGFTEELRVERDRAVEAEGLARERFSQVREMAHEFIFEFHDSIVDLQGATPVRKMVVTKALAYLDNLAGDAEADDQLNLEIARAYIRVGDAQGAVGDNNLGDYPGALESYRKAGEIIDALKGSGLESALLEREAAVVTSRSALIFLVTGRPDEALTLARKSLEVARSIADRDPTNLSARHNVCASYDSVGEVLLHMGRTAEAKEKFEAALACNEENAKSHPEDLSAKHGMTTALNKLASLMSREWHYEAALDYYRRSNTIARSAVELKPDSASAIRNVSMTLEGMGRMLFKLERYDEALVKYQASLAIDRQLAEADPTNLEAQRDLSITYHRVGDVLLQQEKYEESLDCYRKALAIIQRNVDNDPESSRIRSDLATGHSRIGDLHYWSGDLAACEPPYRSEIAIREKIAAEDPSDLWNRVYLAMAHDRLGDVAKAQKDKDKTRRGYEASRACIEALAVSHPENFEVRHYQAGVYEKLAMLEASHCDDPTTSDEAKSSYMRKSAGWYDKAAGILKELDEKGKLNEATREVITKIVEKAEFCRNEADKIDRGEVTVESE